MCRTSHQTPHLTLSSAIFELSRPKNNFKSLTNLHLNQADPWLSLSIATSGYERAQALLHSFSASQKTPLRWPTTIPSCSPHQLEFHLLAILVSRSSASQQTPHSLPATMPPAHILAGLSFPCGTRVIIQQMCCPSQIPHLAMACAIIELSGPKNPFLNHACSFINVSLVRKTCQGRASGVTGPLRSSHSNSKVAQS